MSKSRPEVNLIVQQLRGSSTSHSVIAAIRENCLFPFGGKTDLPLSPILSASPRTHSAQVPKLRSFPTQPGVIRNMLPTTTNEIEFELAVRHPFAYPTLVPICASSLPLQEFFNPCVTTAGSQYTPE